MSWFHSPGITRPATVSLYAVSGPQALRTSGAGILLPGGRVLTAAHVINVALSRPEFATDRPGNGVRVGVRVGVYGREAEVMVWIPVREKDRMRWRGDLAVLELVDDLPPTLTPARWKPPVVDMAIRAWQPAGPYTDLSLARGVVADVPEAGFALLDGSEAGGNIQPGYSGGPVWSETEKAVVGLVMGRFKGDTDRSDDQDRMRRRSWCVTTEGVRQELALAGADHLFDAAHEGSEPPSASEYTELAGILNRRLGNYETLALCGRHVAHRTGLTYPQDGSAPTVDELVRVLLGHPRALAELTDALRRTHPEAVSELVPVGWRIRNCLLLTSDERDRLDALLAALPHEVISQIPSVVRDAIPDIDLAGALPPDTAWLDHHSAAEALQSLLDELELHRRAPATDLARSSLLPALVCLVLQLAALIPIEPGNRLVDWSRKVVDRILDTQDAVGDRLADARARARRLREPGRTGPRLYVQLTPLEEAGGALPHYTLRIWRKQEYGWQRVSTDEDRSYDTAQAVTEIFSKAGTLIRSGVPPLIELAVSREGLELDPHTWRAPGPLGTHRELGVEYPVVISCPELLERGSDLANFQHERRKRLDDGVILRIEASIGDLSDLYTRFAGDLGMVGAVVPDVEAGWRSQIVQYCLAIGLPVVLWGRGEDTWSDACDHLAAVPPRQLPGRVHEYRRRQWNKPTDGRPVLAWSDSTCPDLYLDDPSQENV
ncbi:serine protease [Streptomyces microflavus]|uniref:VMAP-C domain-containing protein n=1 Tax=Streptomyces microflavus TaxID=1919 RepID=UPI002DD94A1C|nr:trypsin-like peptidase domain-containing protein [Streptomyces microflavus]WSA61657.1 serine protease [Streptomyces microflavus]